MYQYANKFFERKKGENKMNVNGLLDQLRHTFHNERDKTSICKRIFLKLDLFMGVICDYFHANVYYHISMKKYMIQSERLDLLLHECEGIIQTFQVLNNGFSKSVFYAYYNVPITVDTIYFEFSHL